jgi:hypothetical protein
MTRKELKLRDSFAKAALPSIITYMDAKMMTLTKEKKEGFDIEQHCCDIAYLIADKMIISRNKN